MSQPYSPQTQHYDPQMDSNGNVTFWQPGEAPQQPRPFNPNTKLYDREGNLTGAKIGAKRTQAADQGKLGLGTLGAERRARDAAQAAQQNPFLSRMDRIAQARADGSFDAKRNAFNAGNSGSYMDERGEIGPRPPAATAAGTAGSAGAPSGAGTAPAGDPAAKAGNAPPKPAAAQPGIAPGSALAGPVGGAMGSAMAGFPGVMGQMASKLTQIGNNVVQAGNAAAKQRQAAEESAQAAQGLYDQRSGVKQRGTDGSVIFRSGAVIEPSRPGQPPGATLQSPYGSGKVEFLPPGAPRTPGLISDDKNKAPSANFFQEHANRTGQANRYAKPQTPPPARR